MGDVVHLEREVERLRAATSCTTRLAKLQSLTASFACARSLRRIGEIVCREMVDAGAGENGAIYLLDETSARIELLDSAGYREDVVARLRSIPISASLPVASAIRNGKPVFVDAEAALRTQVLPPAGQNRSEATFVSIPLLVGDRALGAVTIGYPRARRLDAEDREFLFVIANQAANAVERILLLESERTERDRTARLVALSSAFGPACTIQEVADSAVRLGNDAVGASRTSFFVSGGAGAEIEIVAAVGHPDAARGRSRRTPADLRIGSGAAIRTGAPVWIESEDEWQSHFREAVRVSRAARGTRATIPVVVGGATVGGLHFVFPRWERLTDGQRSFMSALASQCSQAIVRIRAFDEERRARLAAESTQRRFGLLAEASQALSSTLDWDEIPRVAARVAVGTFASWTLVDLLDENGEIRRIAAFHEDPEKQSIAEKVIGYGLAPGSNVHLVLREGKALRVDATATGDVERWTLGPEHAALVRELGVGPTIIAPLRARGRVLGAICFLRVPDRPDFSDEDFEFATELANRAGMALDNARLLRDAQNATRTRDNVIAIVSHDLRNPLGAIAFGATSLLHAAHRPDPARLRKTAEVIQRATGTMTRLLDDLLDLATIASGTLAMRPETVAPPEVMHDAVELFRAIAEDAGVTIDEASDAEMPAVVCDRHRLVQVLSNLLANALKVTPRGRAIRVETRLRGEHVVFAVKDEGPGIRREEVEQIFERFWRGSTASYKGTGLGLAIAKGIVKAHNGAIWVESEVGNGASFYFTIPRHPENLATLAPAK